MNELLRRWAELERALCDISKDGVCLFINDEWVFIYTMAFDAKIFIQYAVQQAVEARGWPWTLWFDFDEHGASIFTDNGKYEYEAEVSAAEALLAAYLRALEAEH